MTLKFQIAGCGCVLVINMRSTQTESSVIHNLGDEIWETRYNLAQLRLSLATCAIPTVNVIIRIACIWRTRLRRAPTRSYRMQVFSAGTWITHVNCHVQCRTFHKWQKMTDPLEWRKLRPTKMCGMSLIFVFVKWNNQVIPASVLNIRG